MPKVTTKEGQVSYSRGRVMGDPGMIGLGVPIGIILSQITDTPSSMNGSKGKYLEMSCRDWA